MWEIFFCGVAVVLSTVLGRAAVGKYGRRYSFFSELKRFNEEFSRNLSFRRKPLTEFVRESLSSYPALKETLRLWAISLENDLPFTAENGDLTEEEIRIANEYFGKAGKNSLQGEKDLLEEYSVYFGQKAAACAEEKKRYSSLGGKLGFLAGMAATIVIL